MWKARHRIRVPGCLDVSYPTTLQGEKVDFLIYFLMEYSDSPYVHVENN